MHSPPHHTRRPSRRGPGARDHQEQFSHETLVTWDRCAHPGGPRGRVSTAPRPASVPTTGYRAARPPPSDAPTSHLVSAPPSMSAEPPHASQGLGIQASMSHKPAPTRLTSLHPPTQVKGGQFPEGPSPRKESLSAPRTESRGEVPGDLPSDGPRGQGRGCRALVSWGHPVSSLTRTGSHENTSRPVPAAPGAPRGCVPTSRSGDQDPAFCCSLTGLSRQRTHTNAKRHHTRMWAGRGQG